MISDERTTLILSGLDVQQVILHVGLDRFMDSLIDRLEAAIRTFDERLTEIPVRSGFHYDYPKPGLVEWMPLYKAGEQVMIKVVGYHPSNPVESGLPTILSTLSAYNPENGHLAALMDGVLATALRTGAASAVATRHLASPSSSVVGIVGCGVQGVTQLHALSRVLDIDRVLITDTDPAALFSFRKRIDSFGLDADVVVEDIDNIVSQSDVVCTATSIEIGEGPLFREYDARPHLHINAVGSDFPGKVELPVELLREAVVLTDFPAQALVEGECQQLKEEEIGPALHRVVQEDGEHKSLRAGLTVFDSTGWALEDQVVMELFLEHASELGLGRHFEIESMPDDSKSPYGFLVVEEQGTDEKGILLNSQDA